MAGAGFKTFNTGDVLTASDVNTYLMQQTVMVFADSSARTTALGANVAEGMISYLKDTNAVEVYNGSAWVSSDDPNAIQNTIVDAKGDLISATAADTPARLAVGTNGQVLTADSSTATGLKWATAASSGDYAAGKNKIINGDFGIWQRGTSFTLSSAVVTYTADRFVCYADGTVTCTASRQAFTAGTAPVSGYESQYFLRTNTTAQSGGSGTYQGQRIEDVRTFAGQTITFSLWAKADSARTYNLYLAQNFGSGGSATVNTSAQSISVTTSWQRFSFTVTLGSISGKTIGTGSSLEAWIYGAANTANTLDTWGWQVEAGSTATPFQTATGTIQGELAACQRYYEKSYNPDVAPATNTAAGLINAMGNSNGGADMAYFISFKVNKRANPTFTFYKEGGASGSWEYQRAGVGTTGSAASAFSIGTTGGSVSVDVGANWTNAWIFGHWVAEVEL